MKKVLVTGGAGFIGSHTVVELVKGGFDPVILDDFSNSGPEVIRNIESIIEQPVTCFRGDCCDESFVRSVFEESGPFSGVIHFAAYKAVGESVSDPLNYYHNNINSLLVVLKVMKDHNCPNFVFSSSCTVYGQPDSLPVTESTETKSAESPYGFTKQIGEQIIRDHAFSLPNLSAALLRYFNPIGAHPSGLIGELPHGTPNNLVPYITQTAAGLLPSLTIYGSDYNTPDGTCIRDYIHVVDLAQAHVEALTWLDTKDKVCEAFNLGSGRGHSVLDVVKSFEKVSGQSLNYELGPRRSGDVEQIYASPSKANQVLKWKTKLDLEVALEDAWNWQKKLTTA